MRRLAIIVAGAIGWSATLPALATERATLWRLQGESNTVYLLGSIHFLRESDYPLPDALLAAYDDAETLIMEIDLDDLDPVNAASVVMSRARIGDGGTLQALLGDAQWERAAAAASESGYRLEIFSGVEPWYAAMALTQAAMLKMGFNPTHGVDMYFSGKAQADAKPIDGLETFEQQISFLDSLPNDVQAEMLLQTLEEIGGMTADMSGMVDAWRTGDVERLEDDLLDSLAQYPMLYDTLLVKRNRAWVEQVEPLLEHDDDYLVVVGALHLVGPDSLNRMLEARGHTLEQLPSAAD